LGVFTPLLKTLLEFKVKLQKLNKCNFKHNNIVTCEGGGEIVVRKRCTAKAASDYTACKFGLKTSVKTDLWRHTVLHGTQRIF